MPKLGFGGMRLPANRSGKGGLDVDLVSELVDAYLAAGLNYFDTAYGYQGGKSETTLREALVKRHPRESFYLADKLPFWEVKQESDMARIFTHQLEKCGVEYFDFYLLHALDDENFEASETYGGYEFIKAQRDAGKVKHIGFSFHGDAKLLVKILDKCPEMEFVQLQINYLDWIDYDAKELYDIVVGRGLPVIVMEPVRGGALAVLPEQIDAMFQAVKPSATAASWAVRFVADLPGVMTILSGMSTMEQLLDNVATVQSKEPITPAEYTVIDNVLDALRAIDTVPCTACKYCEKCPQGIPIADVFSIYNRFAGDMKLLSFRNAYEDIPEANRVSACIECGACEAVCPQGIAIPKRLRESVSVL